MLQQLSEISQSTPLKVMGFPAFIEGNEYEQYRAENSFGFSQTTQFYLQGPAIYGNVGKARLQGLHQFYTPVGSDEPIIIRLGEEPILYWLLKDAVEHLHEEFGDDAVILQLRAQESDEDVLLKVVVYSSLGIEEAEEALSRFDETWWLDNCHRSSSALVFDYAVRC